MVDTMLISAEVCSSSESHAKAVANRVAFTRLSCSGLHKAGLVDKATMREFDAICLTAVQPLRPDEIRALREQVLQPVFAPSANGNAVRSARTAPHLNS